MAITMLFTLWPNTATRAMAKTKTGKACSTSAARITEVLTARRQEVGGGIGVHRAEGRDPGRQQRDQDHAHDDGVADREARPGAQHGEEEAQAPAPGGVGRMRHGSGGTGV